jgi:hypothetical protein
LQKRKEKAKAKEKMDQLAQIEEAKVRDQSIYEV